MSGEDHIADLEEFLRSFVRPLVAGGQLRVGPPIAPARVEQWETALNLVSGSEIAEEIAAERRKAAQLLVTRPAPIELEVDDLRLAVALHSALSLANPDVEGWSAGRARKRIVAASKRMVASVAPAVERRRLLTRHTLLASLARVERIDTRITWWTGSATFRGQPAPQRLLRWQTVRRVRQQRVPQSLDEVLTEDGRQLVAMVLRTSPLSALLGMSELAELLPFDWRGAEGVLRDDELARAVAYAWLGSLDPKAMDEAVARVTVAARAWTEAIGRLPADVLRAVTAFLVHLAALVAVGESQLVDLDGPSPFLTRVVQSGPPPLPSPGGGAPSKALQLPAGPPIASGGALFFLLPEIVAGVVPELGAPPGLVDDVRASRRWEAHRAQVRAQANADETRLNALAQSLRSALAS